MAEYDYSTYDLIDEPNGRKLSADAKRIRHQLRRQNFKRLLEGRPPLPTPKQLQHLLYEKKINVKEVARQFNIRLNTIIMIADYGLATGGSRDDWRMHGCL